MVIQQVALNVHLLCILFYSANQALLLFSSPVMMDLSVSWANKQHFLVLMNKRITSQYNEISWDLILRKKLWSHICFVLVFWKLVNHKSYGSQRWSNHLTNISPILFLNLDHAVAKIGREGLTCVHVGRRTLLWKHRWAFGCGNLHSSENPATSLEAESSRINGRLFAGLALEPVWHKLHCKQLFKHLHLHTWH